MVDEKLSKSLEEIEALADEILSKSQEEVKDDNVEIEKGLKADEIAENTEEKEDNKEEAQDGTEDKEEEDSAENEEDDEKVEKSAVKLLQENEEIAKSIEVSDFLTQFTRINGEVIDSLRADINKSLETSAHTATILAKSFGAIMKAQESLTNLVKSQSEQIAKQEELIKSLQTRLEELEKQPVGRKAVVSTFEKSFNYSAGLTGKDSNEQKLSKSQIIEKLTELALKPNSGVTVSDVVQFESTGQLRPELEHLINN